jgi:spore maturation protein SpmA
MLNRIFVALVLASILLAAFTGTMEDLTQGLLTAAKDAAWLALGLIGVMAFFLGVMKVAEDGGMLRILSRAVWPVLRFLFPSIPRDHPAMSSMILNIVSNMMGLGNAATPFGIKAMIELNRLNPVKGTATNAMVLFLAINTSGLALLPSGVMSIRTQLGSADPAGILVTTWFATGCATVVGVLTAILLSRLRWFREPAPEPLSEEETAGDEPGPVVGEPGGSDEKPNERVGSRPRFGLVVALLTVAAYVAAAVLFLGGFTGEAGAEGRFRNVLSYWILPALVGGVVLFGWSRGVRVYDSLVEGAKEGFQVAKRIIPYLVAILTAVGMLRASGGIDIISRYLSPLTVPLGLPAEALPMALVRPLSGTGALGVMTEIMTFHGPDEYIGYMVSTLYGSTETTFYVLAVYFGAVGIKRTRHALPACLAADVAGISAGVFIVHLLFG